VLSVINGKVEIRIGDRTTTMTQNESVIVPAGLAHGFRNIGHEDLHMQAILASGHFEANPSPEGEPMVRWSSTSPD
jgi:mannose-6-phosphate isomerase-like protein (cupin superfamily)